jgi:hypothetical protein
MTALTFPEISGTGTAVPQGPIRWGSDEHKRLFCKTLLDTFNPYRPAVIDWPKLDDEARARITALPIWDIAVQTENRAGLNVCTYAEGVDDPLLRKAVELNGFEERRHRYVLSNLVEAYGITLAPEPAYPRPKDPEWAFMVTGYSECIDSFFAFGLFEMARRSGFFPEELVATFEPVMHDECHHILLFANWLAWHRARLPWWRRIFFELRVAAAWVVLGWERIGLVRNIDGDGNETFQDYNFTVTGTKAVSADEVSLRDLMPTCLAENERRFSGYDPRLKRPTTIPRLVRLLVRFLRK